ncbi:MAG: non-hydrolyzing UDP-N-acetylglucosamine 2-epimerase [Thermoplasmata archaeon]
MDVSVVIGTRPEIVKMAPIVLALNEAGVPCSLVHTGQHYDRELSEVFLDELGLGKPDAFLEVGSGSQTVQTAQAMLRLEAAFAREGPKLVLVEGDTNTVLAAALASVKIGIDVGHVEAGLRSHDLRMPEEHNRRLTDHLSSFLFAPTKVSEANLRKESVWGRVYVTGNPAIDACLMYLPSAETRSKITEEVRYDEFCLATAHRAENVDNPETLREFVKIFTSSPKPVVYPIHPRTVKRLKEFGLYDKISQSENVQLMPPMGYFDFLVLMKQSLFILTDSGGIQEEATAPNIRKKVFVLRRSTERPEAVASGYAQVVGTEAKAALSRIREYVEDPGILAAQSPYGDGKSGKRIVGIIEELLASGTMPLSESAQF